MMPPLQAIGRAAGTLAAVPASLVGYAIAFLPRVVPLLIDARLQLDWHAAMRRRRG